MFSKEEALWLGAKIKTEINRAGMRQADFAKKMGISPSRLSNYINGLRLPDFFTLCRMADLLNVPLDVFSPEVYSGREETSYILKVSGKCSVTLERVG